MNQDNNVTPGPSGVSRRTVVKGAAWAVPAIAVASAVPAMAASPGPISFTGRACKLPGSSSDIFKGYVFEIVANNVTGPNPDDAVTVINSVTVNGVPEPTYRAVVKTGAGTCSCGTCGGVSAHEFCTPDGTMNQRVLIYTGADTTGSSSNTNFCITYTTYDCNGGTTCTAFFETTEPLCSGTQSTPPTTPGGGSCTIPDVFPLPV